MQQVLCERSYGGFCCPFGSPGSDALLQRILVTLRQLKAELMRRGEAGKPPLDIQLGYAVVLVGCQDEAQRTAPFERVLALTDSELLHVQIFGCHRAADWCLFCQLSFQAQLIFQCERPIDGGAVGRVTFCCAASLNAGRVPAVDFF